MKFSTPLGLAVLLLIFLGSSEAAAKANAKNGMSIKTWLRSMRPKRQDNSLTSDRVWTLADALPGEPERDYPIFAKVPDTDFSCDDKKYGYYADIEARCQAFHVCANTAPSLSKGFGFLCPNGTLFNQRYFICDWYMNVDCDGSAEYYGLNDLIGNGMEGFTREDIMGTAKEMMGFPSSQQQANLGGRGGGGGSGGSPFGKGNGDRIPSASSGGGGGDGNGNRNGNGNRPPSGATGGNSLDRNGKTTPIRGSADLSQPITPGAGGGSNYPYAGTGGNNSPARSGSSSYPSGRPSSGGGGSAFRPQTSSNLPASPGRGANGGTVYVNSLGQLSTDEDSGFDPKKSFILRPDKDSHFDHDPQVPSESFDTLKGIGNSYSFGFPGSDNSNAPLRGSADLSEPIYPSSSTFGKGAPPNLGGGGGNQKQIYTYPHDNALSPQQQQQQNGYQQPSSLSPEYTGQLNTKLNAQSPKYPSSHVYGPPATQLPSLPSSNGAQRGPASPFNQGQQQQQPGQRISSGGGGGQRGPSSVPAGSSYPGSGQSFGGQRPPTSSASLPGGGGGYPTNPSLPTGQSFSSPSYPSSQGSRPSGGQSFGGPASSGSSYPSSQGSRPSGGQSFGGQRPSGGAQAPRPSYPSAGQTPQRGQFPGGQGGRPATSPYAGGQPQQQLQQRGQFPGGQNQLAGGQRRPSQQLSAQNQRGSLPQHKNIPQAYQPSVPSAKGSPSKLYQQPHQASNGQRLQPATSPNTFLQQPQPFAPANQQQQSQRRQYETTGGRGSYYQKPQGGNSGQSNEDFLRVVLKDKNNVHDNKEQLIELIQRFLVPDSAQSRVVSAEVHPSTEQESYSFTYDGNGAATNAHGAYQAPSRSGYHQHTSTCGHQGY